MWCDAPISGMPYLQHLGIGKEWIGAILTKYQPLGEDGKSPFLLQHYKMITALAVLYYCRFGDSGRVAQLGSSILLNTRDHRILLLHNQATLRDQRQQGKWPFARFQNSRDNHNRNCNPRSGISWDIQKHSTTFCVHRNHSGLS